MKAKVVRKLIEKLFAGRFPELLGRACEIWRRRRERTHHELGQKLFSSSRYDSIFKPEFLDQYRSSGEDLDLETPLRRKAASELMPSCVPFDRVADFMRHCPPEERVRIVQTAGQILDNRFPLFSFDGLFFGEPPRWNYDPILEKSAPDIFYGSINYLDPDLCGDVKLVWELSRLQFVFDLGQAYVLTGDERYPQKFFDLLHDWNRCNRDYQGIHFCSALEFAFRLHSVLWALAFFGRSSSLDQKAAVDVYRLAWVTACFLGDHLSVWSSPNTHLLGEAYGLYLGGVLFPEFTIASRNRKNGTKILREELRRQFTSSGMHAERSTSYHAYALEFYLSTFILANRREDSLADDIGARLPAMTSALKSLQRPDGTWPHVGDEDGGRLLFLSRPKGGDYRPLVELADTLSGHCDSGSTYLESMWLSSTDPDPDGLRLRGWTLPDSADSGTTTIRLPGEASYLLFQHGPFGYQAAPHSHADMLHIDISVGRDNFLVDPGTFVYGSDLASRNQYRSWSAHNGPAIVGVEFYDADDPFAWKSRPDCQLNLECRSAEFCYSEAQYSLSVEGHRVVIRRGVLAVTGRTWIVEDHICSARPVQVGWNFITPLQARTEAGSMILAGREGSLCCMPIAQGCTDLQWSCHPTGLSENYLQRTVGQRLLLTGKGTDIRMFTLWQWTPTNEAVPVPETSVQADRCQWSFGSSDHLLALGAAPADAAGIRTNARLCYMRRNGGDMTRLLVVDGSRVHFDGEAVLKHPHRSKWVHAVRGDRWQVESAEEGVEMRLDVVSDRRR